MWKINLVNKETRGRGSVMKFKKKLFWNILVLVRNDLHLEKEVVITIPKQLKSDQYIT